MRNFVRWVRICGFAVMPLTLTGCCFMQRFKKSDCGCESSLEASSVSMSPMVTNDQPGVITNAVPDNSTEGPRFQNPRPEVETTDRGVPDPPPRIQQSKQPDSNAPPKLNTDVTRQTIPGSVTMAVKADKALVRADENVVYEVTLTNSGGSAVAGVALKAIFTDNLVPSEIQPAGSATIDKNVVTFKTIDSLSPTTVTYKIIAKAIRSSRATGRVEFETNASILRSPLTRVVSTPIN